MVGVDKIRPRLVKAEGVSVAPLCGLFQRPEKFSEALKPVRRAIRSATQSRPEFTILMKHYKVI